LALLGAFCARTHLQSDAKAISYWNGWYEKGHKVGYLQTVVQTYPDRYRFERRGRLTTEMMGTVVSATPNTIVNTDRNFALRDFDFTMSSPGHAQHVLGAVRGSKLTMTIESGGRRSSSTLEIKGPVYPLEALPNLIVSKNLTPKVKYEITVFDPMVQNTSDAEIVVLGSEQLKLRDTTRQALKVTALLFGIPHTVWIDSNAVVLREEAPPSSVTLLEPSAVAMSTRPEQAPPDLMRMFAVPSSVKLDNPRQLKYIKMELAGIDPRKFDLEDESQKVLNMAPLVLAIAPARPPATSVGFPIAGDAEALAPTLAVQSGDAQIVRKAREIAGTSTDAVTTAKAINDWVFTSVRQKGTPSMPSATDVLQTLEGDCNEHAVLYAALCRALGIPCKIVVGLVYRDGYFWYHAWNRVYLGAGASRRPEESKGEPAHPAGWVPVDPTFGQFPVDATHLKLKEGEMDKQAQLLTVVGNLAIRIIEQR
jgi:transglutaminase-like putative cysteine protease